MTRIFRRRISMFVGLFLPTMMISFLYYRNETLQKKISHSLQPDQRLFPKSLPAEDSPTSAWQLLVYSTPFYRAERNVEGLISLPMAMPGMTSEKKQMITTRAAIEMYPLRESKETVGSVEGNAMLPQGDVLVRTVKAPAVSKKRSSKRSRRTSNRVASKSQGLSQVAGADIPVKQEGLTKKQIIPAHAAAPAAEGAALVPVMTKHEPTTARSLQTSGNVVQASEKDNELKSAPLLESDHVVQSPALMVPINPGFQSTTMPKIITEIANDANDILNIPLVNKTKLEESIAPSNLESSKHEIHVSRSLDRKSNKRPDKQKVAENQIDEKVGASEGLNVSELEAVQNKTGTKEGMTIQEELTKQTDVLVKPPPKKDDAKIRRDRKTRSRRKSKAKEVMVKEPVTLPLKFNFTNSNTQLPVILASTNKAFLNFTDNWLESVKRTGIRSGVTLVAEDPEAYNYLKSRTDMDLNVVLNDVSESPGERLLFDSPAYKQLVNKRPSYILQLLLNGRDVLFSDMDIVWLQNPLPYFANDTNDIWLQEDIHGEPWSVYCAGFTFYRSTPPTIALVTEWVQTLALHPTYPDQRVLNGLLRKKRWQEENIRRGVMDSRLFPSGHLYFDPEWRKANTDIKQVMVHNNWIVGHDRKVERFKNEGLWYLDDRQNAKEE